MCHWHCFRSCDGWSLFWGRGFGPFPWTFLKKFSLDTPALPTATGVWLLGSISHQQLPGTEQRQGGEWCLWAEEAGIHWKPQAVLCGRQFTSTADCSASHAGELLLLNFPTASCLDTWRYLCGQRGSKNALVCMFTVQGSDVIEGEGCEE